MPLRFDDVPPKVAFADARSRATELMAEVSRRALRARPPGRSSTAGSTRRAGPSCRPSSARRSDAGRRHAGRPDARARLRHLRLPRRRGRRRRQHRLDDAARRRHRDGDPPGAAAAVPSAPLAPRGKTRLFARLRGGHGRGDSLTVPFGAPALLSGRLTRAPTAPGSPAASCGSSPGPRAAPSSRPRSQTVRDRRAGRLRAAARRRGPRAGSPSPSPATAASRPASRPRWSCGCAPASRCGPSPLALRTGEVVRLSGRVRSRGAPIPRRGKLVAIQYLEAGDPPLAPGPRHPHRPRRPLPRPLPLPLRQRRRRDPPARDGAGRGALALRARLLAARSTGPGQRSARVRADVASHPSHQRRGDRARAARRGRAEDRRELPQALRRRVLRRARLPPGDPRLHDPGRLPGGHRHAAAPATPSRTSSTTTRSCAGRWRWPTPGPTPTAPSSSSSPPARRPGSTASTPSSARSIDGMDVVDAIESDADRRLRQAARAADDRARRARRGLAPARRGGSRRGVARRSRRRRSASPGRQRLTRPATRVTRKIWPIIISRPEIIRPGWPPGTRLP